MSWVDDIRCLHCDGKLPLYRKITNGQFCNTAHRKAYWQEQERLAVERLMETHDSLRAYRAPGVVQQILGQADMSPEIEAPVLRRRIKPRLLPKAVRRAEIVAADPLAYEISGDATGAQPPAWFPQIIAGRQIPMADFVVIGRPALPRWLSDQIAAVEPEAFAPVTLPFCPEITAEITKTCDVAWADLVAMSLVERIATRTSGASSLILDVTPMDTTPHEAFYPLLLAAPSQSEELQRLLDQQIPDPAGPFGIPRFAIRGNTQPECVRQPGVIPTALRTRFSIEVIGFRGSAGAATLLFAGLRRFSLDQAPRTQVAVLRQGASLDGVCALALRARVELPKFAMTQALSSGLSLAPGRRYAARIPEAAAIAGHLPPSGFATIPPAISLPERKAKSAAASASSVPAPCRSGLVPLACTAKPSHPASDQAAASSAYSIPQPPRAEPMRPASKLEPIDAKPISDLIADPLPDLGSAMPEPKEQPASKVHVWTHAIDFCKNAPRDLKMLVFAIPVLLGLALHPSLPKVRVAAPATAAGIQRNFQRVVNNGWGEVRQSVLDRAAVALDEDFRAGLDDWASRGDATTEWSFDATGFVRPGPLALYRPSVGLTDYQMQFLGLIDKKALSWVVRAADFDNYYVVKMVVVKPGPLPTIGVTRYAVVNGKADSRSDTLALIDARPDMLYRVRMDVNGDTFSLTVQGQMVDSWSEPRLRHGGVGFFSARGEESRLRWVQVTHQYDMLGRLCAYLAPYNISSMNGSWQQ
jgi:hypothetical protein